MNYVHQNVVLLCLGEVLTNPIHSLHFAFITLMLLHRADMGEVNSVGWRFMHHVVKHN